MQTGSTTQASTRTGNGGVAFGPNAGGDMIAPHTAAELLPGTRELITAVRHRLLAGHAFNNPTFSDLVVEHLGGRRMHGTFSSKYAYDVLEVAVNGMLLHGDARALMKMKDPLLGLTHALRPRLGQLPTQTDRTHEQQLLQQFSSPPTLAFVAARVLNPRSDDLVIEPSAGTGSLAIWPRAVGAEVIANEISPRRRALLGLLGFRASEVDAEFFDDLYPAEVVPSAVLMNPPFSATGGRVGRNSSRFGARHFESMLKRLAVGGRLVGVAGEGMRLDKPSFSAWWQEVAKRYTVRAVVGLNGREYAKLGTTFDNCLIVIDKTGPTPGDSWKQQLQSVRWGNVERLEEAWTILAEIVADRPALGEVRYESKKSSPRCVVSGEPAALEAQESGAAPDAELALAATPAVPSVETPTQDTSFTEQASNAKSLTVSATREDEGTADAEADIFVPYTPTMLTGGVDHPAHIVESRSMGSVYPPPITYRPHFPKRVVKRGLLSALQLERVCYAGQAHEQRLPNGARGGFFVGDGTGVGKGRILAGIIVDNWFQGRDRAVWLSVNNDLMDSARRDLNDLSVCIPLHKINDFNLRKPITVTCGVMFSSYHSLIASAKSGETRLAQLQEWLGTNGVIILDEAHKAKNALAGGHGEPTQTGQAVIDLQNLERNPDYRVVYSSATGATDVRNMAYMTR